MAWARIGRDVRGVRVMIRRGSAILVILRIKVVVGFLTLRRRRIQLRRLIRALGVSGVLVIR